MAVYIIHLSHFANLYKENHHVQVENLIKIRTFAHNSYFNHE